jgi:biopolymer transport protein ExbD
MTPEELYAKKKADKKAARRDKPEEAGALNITSLMDVVSIIVVYLLKNYGTDPVVITPSGGQKLPMSTADTPLQEGSPIYISKRDITFGDRKVVQLDEEGNVDQTALKKHSIIPLYDLMAEEADKSKQMAAAKGEEWVGRIIVVGDQELKFSTLVDVMYTAGQAEYSEYVFCVIQRNG